MSSFEPGERQFSSSLISLERDRFANYECFDVIERARSKRETRVIPRNVMLGRDLSLDILRGKEHDETDLMEIIITNVTARFNETVTLSTIPSNIPVRLVVGSAEHFSART